MGGFDVDQCSRSRPETHAGQTCQRSVKISGEPSPSHVSSLDTSHQTDNCRPADFKEGRPT